MKMHNHDDFMAVIEATERMRVLSIRPEHVYARHTGNGVVIDVLGPGHATGSETGTYDVVLRVENYEEVEAMARELWNISQDLRSRDTSVSPWSSPFPGELANAIGERVDDTPAIPDVPTAAQVVAIDVNGQTIDVQEWLLQLSDAVSQFGAALALHMATRYAHYNVDESAQ